ncbi:MAG: Cys-tRNA(Pro) deacylase [Atopobiaceae bacterium]|jgi:Cys-tRNA(Pro)/Cys-tRNA(Cys) deacylase
MARKEKFKKSNAMRELERGGVAYTYTHVEEEDTSRGLGVRLAEETGADVDSTFKTLVCVAPSGDHVVCCIPVADELDFKKAASAAGEKSLSMLPTKELEGVTGYVRGGCSPVGMKKQFPTLIDETAQLFDTIGISGGRRGLSLELSPVELKEFLGATFADITR